MLANMTKKIGRPTLLTPALSKRIVEHIEEGCPLDVAAELEGIYRRRAEEWLAKGRAEDAEEPYASFAREVMRARARVAGEVLREIRGAHYLTKDGREIPNAQAQQWYAERVLGYSPKERVVEVHHAPEEPDTPERIDAALTVLKMAKGAK